MFASVSDLGYKFVEFNLLLFLFVIIIIIIIIIIITIIIILLLLLLLLLLFSHISHHWLYRWSRIPRSSNYFLSP